MERPCRAVSHTCTFKEEGKQQQKGRRRQYKGRRKGKSRKQPDLTSLDEEDEDNGGGASLGNEDSTQNYWQWDQTQLRWYHVENGRVEWAPDPSQFG